MTIDIIAEIGQNHNGDMRLARTLIAEAARNGATVAKFQLYDAKSLFPKANNPWFSYNCSTELSRQDLIDLHSCCVDHNIEFMASPFDLIRVEWLEDLNVKRYKLASRSIYDESLIACLESTNKPIIASLGLWIKSNPALTDLPTIKNSQFLYCISSYPTEPNQLSFSNVDFDLISGFSDHTLGLHASFMSIARGASIIEKHFTLDKSMFGPDHSCSMVPEDLKELASFAHFYEQAL